MLILIIIAIGSYLFPELKKDPLPKGDGTWEGTTYVLDKEPASDVDRFNVTDSDIKIKGVEELTFPTDFADPPTLVQGMDSLGRLASLSPNVSMVTNSNPEADNNTVGTVYWVKPNRRTTTTEEWQTLLRHTRSKKHLAQVDRWLKSNPAAVSPSGNRLALIHSSAQSRVQFFEWSENKESRKSYPKNVPAIKEPGKKILDLCWLDEESIVTRHETSFSIWKIPSFDPGELPTARTVATRVTTIDHPGKSILLHNSLKMAIVEAANIELIDLLQTNNRAQIPVLGNSASHVAFSQSGAHVAYLGKELVVVDLIARRQTVLEIDDANDVDKSSFQKAITSLALRGNHLYVEAIPSLIVDWKKGFVLNTSNTLVFHKDRVWQSYGSPRNRYFSSALDEKKLAPESAAMLPSSKKFKIEIDCFDQNLAPNIGTAIRNLINAAGGEVGDGDYSIKLQVVMGEQGKFTALGAKRELSGDPPKIPSIDFELKVTDENGDVSHVDNFFVGGGKSVRLEAGSKSWPKLDPKEEKEIIEKLKKRVSNFDRSDRFGYHAAQFKRWLDDNM